MSNTTEATSLTSTPARTTLGILERKDAGDIPFYDGLPATISSWRWVAMISASVVGFLLLSFLPQPDNVAALLPRTLFTLVPLAAFILLTKGFWKSIFRPFRGRDVRAMFGFAALNMAVSAGVGILVAQLFGANANHAVDGLAGSGPLEYVAFYAGSGIQLFGEELFAVIPMLAVMYWLRSKLHVNRTTALVIAWVVSSLWFGAAHLPTYGWNFAQALLIIGVARMVLTLAYIRTKNLGVSYGAHVLGDWTEFTVPLVLAGLAAS